MVMCEADPPLPMPHAATVRGESTTRPEACLTRQTGRTIHIPTHTLPYS